MITAGSRAWHRSENGTISRVVVRGLGSGYVQIEIPPTRGIKPVAAAEVYETRDEAAGLVDCGLTPWLIRIDDEGAVCIVPCTVVRFDGPTAELADGSSVFRDRLAPSCVLAHHQARSWMTELNQDGLLPAPALRTLTAALVAHAGRLSPNVREATPVDPSTCRYHPGPIEPRILRRLIERTRLTEHVHTWEPAGELSSSSRSAYRCACGAAAARKYNRRTGFGPLEVHDATELSRQASGEADIATRRARSRNATMAADTNKVLRRATERHVEDRYTGKG